MSLYTKPDVSDEFIFRSKDEGHHLVWNILEIMTRFESCDLRYGADFEYL